MSVPGAWRQILAVLLLPFNVIVVPGAILWQRRVADTRWPLEYPLLGVPRLDFRLIEEPGLVRRFGDDYEEYRRNVPRWLPRRRPWRQP